MVVKIQEIDKNDIQKAIALHNTTFSDSRTIKHWNWMYTNQNLGEPVFTIAKDGDAVVGTQGMIPINLFFGKQLLRTGKSENTIVHSNYRGGPLFQSLYEYAVSCCYNREIACLWGYTTAGKPLKRVNFLVSNNVMAYALSVLNFSSALLEIRKRKLGAFKTIAVSVLALLSSVYSFILRNTSGASQAGYILRKKLLDPADINRFYKQLEKSNPGLIYIDQNERYQNWRIYEHPFIQYKTYFIYMNDSLVAYAYVNSSVNCLSYITDFGCNTLDAGKFLLCTLLNDLNKEHVGFVSFFGNHQNVALQQIFYLLRRLGFVKVKASMAFVLRNLSIKKDEKELTNLANWYMTGLWTDGFSI